MPRAGMGLNPRPFRWEVSALPLSYIPSVSCIEKYFSFSRYEHEEVSRMEGENRIQQLMKKMEFDEKVGTERVAEMQARIQASAATILSLKAKLACLPFYIRS